MCVENYSYAKEQQNKNGGGLGTRLGKIPTLIPCNCIEFLFLFCFCQEWKKFGDAIHDRPTSNGRPDPATTQVADEVYLALTTNKEVRAVQFVRVVTLNMVVAVASFLATKSKNIVCSSLHRHHTHVSRSKFLVDLVHSSFISRPSWLQYTASDEKLEPGKAWERG